MTVDRVITAPFVRLTAMQWADIGERTVWTVLQSGVAVAIVQEAGLPPALAVLLTGVLALLKTYSATRMTSTKTAGTLPPSLTPVPVEPDPITPDSPSEGLSGQHRAP